MRRLYWLNAALLGAHQVDAGYWREWQLLHLPGGEGGFVLLHVVVFLVLLWGFESTVEGGRGAIAWTTVLGALGLLTAAGHGVLLWLGTEAFRSSTSVGLLAAIGLASLLQLAMARFESRVRARSAGRGGRVFLELN